jgi:hypothetical protein
MIRSEISKLACEVCRTGGLEGIIDALQKCGALKVDPDPPAKSLMEVMAEKMIGVFNKTVVIFSPQGDQEWIIDYTPDSEKVREIRKRIVPWLEKAVNEASAKVIEDRIADGTIEETPARKQIRRNALAEGKMDGARQEREQCLLIIHRFLDGITANQYGTRAAKEIYGTDIHDSPKL